VLTVPKTISQVQNMLLAFDGSPKAWEALYLAGHLSANLEIPLHVTHVLEEPGGGQAALYDARTHLGANDRVEFHSVEGQPVDAVLTLAENLQTDLILMGGYTANPWMEIFTGSTVEQMLRQSDLPLLICR
jgi:nucleotide-binding universal stress UspA family protein